MSETTNTDTGSQKILNGGRYITYGVGENSPIRGLWVLLGHSHMLLADITVDTRSLVPPGVRDQAGWIRSNLDRFYEFMTSVYEAEPVSDNHQTWEEDGLLRFTAYADSYDDDLTEKQAFDRILSETQVVAIHERAGELGGLYREWLNQNPPETEQVTAAWQKLYGRDSKPSAEFVNGWRARGHVH